MSLRGKTACLWHAYNALSEESRKSAAKGQLKVLTHNLASLFHLTDVEKKLETLFAVDSVFTFTDYLSFLRQELFEPLTKADSSNAALTLPLDQIDNVCWFVCSRTYSKKNNAVLNDDDIYKLWRLFNSLAETDDDLGEAIFPVVIDLEEAEGIFQRIMAVQSMEHKRIDFESVVGDARQLSFPQFLHAIESHCLAGKESTASATVAQLFDDEVLEVLKKGYLQRKGHGITGGWKDVWCVLTLTRFCLYSSRDEKELKEELIITKSCKLENLTERSGISIGNIGLGVKSNRFVLSSEATKSLEMSAQDAKTKSEWLSALQSALDWTCKASSPRQLALKMRKQERAEKRRRLEKEAEQRQLKEMEIMKALMELGEEKKARLDVEERIRLDELRLVEEQRKMEETRKLLEEEKLAREKAEHAWLEETQLREQEQQRLREMEQLHRELEALLEAERQAKHDEEIVRLMQAKILQEEFEHREQLEKMRADLERLLEEAQQRNIGLEEIQMKQEAFIQEEQQKLAALEKAKERQEQEHLAAVTKLQKAEQLKAQMEEELKRKEIEQQKFVSSTTARSPLTLQTATHRGMGAFVGADYTKRHDLTPVTPNSPAFNVVKVCRTPLSPPVFEDLVRSSERNKDDLPRIPPPVPAKNRNRSNLRSLGDSEQETPTQECPLVLSAKHDDEQEGQKAEITKPPPVPTKKQNRSNLRSLGDSEQETPTQECPLVQSPKQDEEQEHKKVEITKPPPVPTKKRNRSNLRSLGDSEQETPTQECPLVLSPKQDDEQERQKASGIEVRLADACVNGNDV